MAMTGQNPECRSNRYITNWSAAVSIVAGQGSGRTITIDDRNVRVFNLVNP